MESLKKILLVDDDIASNYLTSMILMEMDPDSQLYVTENGEKALELMHEHCQHVASAEACPELILLDIHMPVMNGFEFLEQFEKLKAKEHINIPVVVLTSSLHSRDMEKARQYPIASYLEKPITEDKMRAVLHQINGRLPFPSSI